MSHDSWLEKEEENLMEEDMAELPKRFLFGWSIHTRSTNRPLEGPVPRPLPPPPTVRSSNRLRQRRPDSDDMSECTIDTSIRESHRQQQQQQQNHHHHHNNNNNINNNNNNNHNNNHSSPSSQQQQSQQQQPSQQQQQQPNQSIHRLIAELKLELANLKSDSDRTCLRMKRLETTVKVKEDAICVLTQENCQLRIQLKAMETRFLVLSMGQTVGTVVGSSSNSSHYTSRDAAADTATSASSSNPYRTQFGTCQKMNDNENDNDNDNDDDDICLPKEKEGLSIEFHQDMLKSIRFNEQEDDLEEDESLQDVCVLDLHRDTSWTCKLDQKSVHTRATETSSTHVQVYPDDDPFSTLNAVIPEEEAEVEKPTTWFRWSPLPGLIQSSTSK